MKKRNQSAARKIAAYIAASPHCDDLQVIADDIRRKQERSERYFGTGSVMPITIDDLPHVSIRYVEEMGILGKYVVSINHGAMRYGPDGYGWTRRSEESARRKGERELAKYIRREAREIRENRRLGGVEL